MSVADKLTELISEVTKLDRMLNTANEQLLSLEKEKEESFKSFNTETHVLIEKDFLKDITSALDNARDCSSYAKDEADNAASEADNSASNSGSSIQYLDDTISDINDFLSCKNGSEEEGEDE